MKYKTTLLGCSRISAKHIDGFARNADRMTLAGVCDLSADRAMEKANEYRAKTGGAETGDVSVKCYSDYRQMIQEERPDLVTIATESGKHYEMAMYCLEAGCHVITEKPMALSIRHADEMIKAAKKAGKEIAVCFQNRFSAPVQRLRAALDAGRFGRIMHGMIQIRWNRGDSYYAEAPWRGTWEQDGGTLMNQCIHGIDLLQWMLGGDAVRVHAQTRRFLRPIEAEDFGAAIVEFSSGAVGIIEGTALSFPKNLNETLSVFGEKGTVVIGGTSVNRIETWRFADAEAVGDTEETVLNSAVENNLVLTGHAALFRDFVKAVDLGGQPLVSGGEGKKALEIILAIYKSQKTGLPVDLPCDFSTNEMKGYF